MLYLDIRKRRVTAILCRAALEATDQPEGGLWTGKFGRALGNGPLTRFVVCTLRREVDAAVVSTGAVPGLELRWRGRLLVRVAASLGRVGRGDG